MTPCPGDCTFVEEREPSGRLILGPCLGCGTSAMDALAAMKRRLAQRSQAGADLSLVPLAALVDQLGARADHGVIAIKQCGQPNPQHTLDIRRWWGNRDTCLGMASRIQHKINLDQDEDEQEAPPDVRGMINGENA